MVPISPVGCDGCSFRNVKFSRAEARENWGTRARLLHILDKSTFGKACNHVAADHEVIECADIHQRQRLFQRLREKLVGTTRFGNTGRMVVGVMCPESLRGTTWHPLDLASESSDCHHITLEPRRECLPRTQCRQVIAERAAAAPRR